MDLKTKLSQRIHLSDIHEIIFYVGEDTKKKQELYELLFDVEEKVAYQAAWVMCHFSTQEMRWLYSKQNALIDAAMSCAHEGKRRLLLTLLFEQPLANPQRVDFLNYCMNGMLSKDEPLGIRALCIKIAYELCRTIPELIDELKSVLELMEGELPPAIASAKRNVFRAMEKGRSLQS